MWFNIPQSQDFWGLFVVRPITTANNKANFMSNEKQGQIYNSTIMEFLLRSRVVSNGAPPTHNTVIINSK